MRREHFGRDFSKGGEQLLGGGLGGCWGLEAGRGADGDERMLRLLRRSGLL